MPPEKGIGGESSNCDDWNSVTKQLQFSHWKDFLPRAVESKKGQEVEENFTNETDDKKKTKTKLCNIVYKHSPTLSNIEKEEEKKTKKTNKHIFYISSNLKPVQFLFTTSENFTYKPHTHTHNLQLT